MDALHVLSHGEAGVLRLGDVAITAESLADHADILRTIGSALSDDGDILLYACDLAAGEGVALIGHLATEPRSQMHRRGSRLCCGRGGFD